MKTGKMKIGIIGCGAIGSLVARYCTDALANAATLEALFDLDKNKAKILRDALSNKIPISTSIDQVIRKCDLIIETASVEAAPQVLEKAARAGKDVMIMSVGGIVEREDLLSLARKNNCKVYIPSGAVFGLDGIKAAALKRIDEIILTTKKPIEGLKDAPYIEDNKIDLGAIKAEKLIFEGSVQEAIKAFPKNINVSAALSLAGPGAKRIKVRVVCSPGCGRNIHEIELKGECGTLFARAENLPMPDNPKTSYMAGLSAIATLRGIIDSVRVGT